MIQKAEMIIEKFDQGITVRWRDIDGNAESKKSLASKGSEYKVLGDELWGDINDVLANTLTDQVIVNVEYRVLDI